MFRVLIVVATFLATPVFASDPPSDAEILGTAVYEIWQKEPKDNVGNLAALHYLVAAKSTRPDLNLAAAEGAALRASGRASEERLVAEQRVRDGAVNLRDYFADRYGNGRPEAAHAKLFYQGLQSATDIAKTIPGAAGAVSAGESMTKFFSAWERTASLEERGSIFERSAPDVTEQAKRFITFGADQENVVQLMAQVLANPDLKKAALPYLPDGIFRIPPKELARRFPSLLPPAGEPSPRAAPSTKRQGMTVAQARAFTQNMVDLAGRVTIDYQPGNVSTEKVLALYREARTEIDKAQAEQEAAEKNETPEDLAKRLEEIAVKKETILKAVGAALAMAEHLAGDDKNVRGLVNVLEAGVDIGLLSVRDVGLSLVTGIWGVCFSLGSKLASLFSNQKSTDELILEQLAELKKLIYALTDKIDNRFDGVERQIASLRTFLHQEFDMLTRTVRAGHDELRERARSSEAMSRTAALLIIHEAKQDQARLMELFRKMEGDDTTLLARSPSYESYVRGMTALAHTANFYSRGPVATGGELPKGDQAQSLYIPNRHGESDTSVLSGALAALGVNIVPGRLTEIPRPWNGTEQELEKTFHGPLNISEWARSAGLWHETAARVADRDPANEIYESYLLRYDGKLDEQRMLMDSAYLQLEAFRQLAPEDASMRPAIVPHLMQLFAHYEKRAAALAQAIVDDFKPIVAPEGELKGYNPLKPAAEQTLAEGALEKADFVVQGGAIAPCRNYVPRNHEGREALRPALPARSKDYAKLLPKEVLLARDLLGGEIQWCYEAIGVCEDKASFRKQHHEHRPNQELKAAGEKDRNQTNLIATIDGRLCAEIRIQYSHDLIGTLDIGRKFVGQTTLQRVGERTYMPVFTRDGAFFDPRQKYLPRPSDPANAAVYDEATAENRKDEGAEYGELKGFQARGTVEENGLIRDLPGNFYSRWRELEAGIGNAPEMMTKEQIAKSIAIISEKVNDKLGTHLREYLTRRLGPDIDARSGKIGIALGHVEAARILLAMGLWYGLGDEVLENDELRGLLAAVPGEGTMMRALLGMLQASDAEPRMRQVIAPVRKLLAYLVDPKQTPLIRRWTQLQEPLNVRLEPLYLIRKRKYRMDQAPRSAELSTYYPVPERTEEKRYELANLDLSYLLEMPRFLALAEMQFLLSYLEEHRSEVENVATSEGQRRDVILAIASFCDAVIANPNGPRLSSTLIAALLTQALGNGAVPGVAEADGLLALHRYLVDAGGGGYAPNVASATLAAFLKNLSFADPKAATDELAARLAEFRRADETSGKNAAQLVARLNEIKVAQPPKLEEMRAWDGPKSTPNTMRNDAAYALDEKINLDLIDVVEKAIADVSARYERMVAAHAAAEQLLGNSQVAPRLKEAEIRKVQEAMEKDLLAAHAQYEAARAANVESGKRCHERRVQIKQREEYEARTRRRDSK